MNARGNMASLPALPAADGGSELWRLMRERIGWKKILLGLLLFGLSVLAIAPALHGGKIWDDDPLIFHNPLIKDPLGIIKFWWTHQTPDYFPVTSSGFWMEWRLWGLHYFAWRLVNVGFHALGAIFLWRVLKQLHIPAAWLGAALFAVHPVTVETTAWIAELKNTLSWALFMLAWMLYLDFDDKNSRWIYGFSIAAFVLALLAKTTVVMLPVLLLLSVWWRRGGIKRQDIWKTTPFFLASLALGLVTCWYQWESGTTYDFQRSIGARIAGLGWEVWFYLWKDIDPHPLIEIYPRWIVPATQWWAWLPDLALVTVLAAAWRWRSTWGKPVLMALGGFCIVLLPVLGLLKMSYWAHSLVADHLQYLGVPFVTAFFAGGGAALTEKLGLAWKKPALALAALVLALELGVSFHQSRIYKNADDVWDHTLEYNSGSWGAHMNAGVAALKKKNYALARKDLDIARKLNHSGAAISYDLGLMYQSLKEYKKALHEFLLAINTNEYQPLVICHLARCYIHLGQPEKGLDDLYRGLKLMPGSASLYMALSAALERKGQYALALKAVTVANKLDPYNPLPQYDQAYLLDKTGQWRQALKQYRRALAQMPKFAQGRYLYAKLLLKHGHVGGAAAQLDQVLTLRPNNAPAHALLGEVLAAEDHPRQAAIQRNLARRALAAWRTHHPVKKPVPEPTSQKANP